MDKSEIKLKQGIMLVSAPQLKDFFKRSVIFITEHNENGSVGFVLNKPTKFSIKDIVEEFPEFPSKVFIGGPVQADLVNIIHKAGDILTGGIEICDGIYWGCDFDILKLLAEENRINTDDILFFVGYSGWSPGQLESEIMANSWILTESTENYIFNKEPGKIWNRILKDMGGDYAIISMFPEDPSVN
jgi:putative transcriptional regulator